LRSIAIRDHTCDEIAHDPCDTAVPGVLNVPDVFQLIVEGLDQGALPQEPRIPQAPQTMLPMPAHFRAPCEPVMEEHVMQGLRDISAVAKALPAESCGESLDGLAVLNIAWRQSQGQQFALVVDDARQRAAAKPSPSRSSPGWRCLQRPWAW